MFKFAFVGQSLAPESEVSLQCVVPWCHVLHPILRLMVIGQTRAWGWWWWCFCCWSCWLMFPFSRFCAANRNVNCFASKWCSRGNCPIRWWWRSVWAEQIHRDIQPDKWTTTRRRNTIIMDNPRRSGGVGEVQFCIKCAIKESFYDLVVGCWTGNSSRRVAPGL